MIHSFRVQQDWETPAHAGAGDLFQVIGIYDEEDNDVTKELEIDVGRFYSSLEDLQFDIAKKLDVRLSDVVLNDE